MSLHWPRTMRQRRRLLRPEHAEHSALLRLITLAMAWCAGLALGVATGDLLIAVILTLVITAGHQVSWRTRTWRSAKWQFILLVPIAGVAILLVPSLPFAFQGDWLHPMRYLLLLQALASFYLHSRASLYTAQMLSAVVLMVSSQLAFDSLFLFFFFFTFFLLLLAFLFAATTTDALRSAIATTRWPGLARRVGWTAAVAVTVVAVSVPIFLVLPWGTIQRTAGASDMLPLTGEARPGSAQGGGEGNPGDQLPLTGAVRPGEGPEAGARPLPGAPRADGAPGPDDDVGPGTGEPAGPRGENGAPAGPRDVRGEGSPGDQEYEEPPPLDGPLPDTTVMQVRSPVKSYWRGQTYSAYDGQRWVADTGFVALDRPVRSDLYRYTQTFRIRRSQESPLLGYSPIAWVPVSRGQAALPLEEGSVYRVVSEQRDFHPTTLDLASRGAVVNRGIGNLPPRVWDLAQSLTMDAAGPSAKALAITQYLRSNYTYVESAAPLEESHSIESFLFGGHRSGSAFDFASAQTALAVGAGLNARLVTGYLPGELDPLSGSYVVRSSDAHAWTEVGFGGRAGWVPFDGTPRLDGQAREVPRGRAAGAVADLFRLRLGDDVRQALSGVFQEVVDGAGRVLTLVAMAIVALGSAWLAHRMWRRRSAPKADAYSRLPGNDRRRLMDAYRRLVRTARRTVGPRQQGEPLDAYFARIATAYPHLRDDLMWLSRAASSAVYRVAPLPEEMTKEAGGRFQRATLYLRAGGHV